MIPMRNKTFLNSLESARLTLSRFHRVSKETTKLTKEILNLISTCGFLILSFFKIASSGLARNGLRN